MAAPLAHIILALQALVLLPSITDKQAFIVGTSFPDIRYPASAYVDRNATHWLDVTWEDVKNEADPFKAGMFFHSLVDVVRMRYLESEPIISPIIYETAQHCAAFKFFEDVYLAKRYEKLIASEHLAAYFKNILPQEQHFTIPDNLIQQWHDALVLYLSNPIDVDAVRTISKTIKPESVKQLMHRYHKIVKHAPSQTLQLIDAFYASFFERIGALATHTFSETGSEAPVTIHSQLEGIPLV